MPVVTPIAAKRDQNDVVWTTPDAGGDTFANDGRQILLVKNDSGSAINVTVTTPLTIDGEAHPDVVVPVAAGSLAPIGRFPPKWYGVEVNFLCSATVDVNVAVIQP